MTVIILCWLGKAENLKSGACLISDSIVYHMDGVDAWDEGIVNTRLQVEGEFFIEFPPPKDSLQLPPYEYLLIVRNPKW